MPCAAQNNHSVVYVDLSNKKIPVASAFLMALERAVQAGGSSSFNFIKNIFFSEKNNEKIEYHMNSHTSINKDLLVDKVPEHLASIEARVLDLLKKSRVFLIFDHAHNLSGDQLTYEFCAFLRNLLVTHRERLKPIYGTSDMQQWASVFKNPRSPLNSEGASVHKLPVLDRVFVKQALQKSEILMDLDQGVQCFHLLHNRPDVFMRMLIDWRAQSQKQDDFLEFFKQFVIDLEGDKSLKEDQRMKNSVLYH